jgi:hypothetical protein
VCFAPQWWAFGCPVRKEILIQKFIGGKKTWDLQFTDVTFVTKQIVKKLIYVSQPIKVVHHLARKCDKHIILNAI